MSSNLTIKGYDNLNKSFAATFFEYMLDYERFAENYKLLLKNLSEDQQRFLISTFTRILYMHHSQYHLGIDFTPAELMEQVTATQNYWIKVVQDGHCYKYRDLILPKKFPETSLFYYEMGINFIKNKDRLIGTDFIDAGAYVGDSALILNRLKPSKIYGFEPAPSDYCLMKETIKLNNLQNVLEPINMGLGRAPADDCYSYYDKDLKKNVEVTFKVDSIDNYVENLDLSVGLIKIDTEGRELDILRGAENTIRKFKPVIIAGIYHNAEQFFEFKPILESWDLGYKFYFEKLNPNSFINEINLLCEVY